MNSRPPLRFRHSAFTLVELLTVIAIIAILMGLLFPAIQIVKDQANKVKAKTDIVNTVAAVKQYYTEYGKYPLGTNATTPGTDITFGQTANGVALDNASLYNILRNYPGVTRDNPDANPRQIVFFEGKAGISAGTGIRNGFVPTTGSYTGANGGALNAGAYCDPWGYEYGISVDGDYDSYSPVPLYKDFPAPTTPPQGSNFLSSSMVNVGCAAWSVGKDGKIGTTDGYFKSPTSGPSDDVISWQ